MAIHFPKPLQAGSVIAVTSPSSGISPELAPRFAFCKEEATLRGFTVREGMCLHRPGLVSGTAQERADEFTSYACDHSVSAVIPPWGGELAINCLELIDWERIQGQQSLPWVVGWSDISTLILPLTLLTGTATLHGINFMDLPMKTPPGLVRWHEVLTLKVGESWTQSSVERFAAKWTPYQEQPHADTFDVSESLPWKILGEENDASAKVNFSGRLIGGCLDVISFLSGSEFGDVECFGAEHRDTGLIIYLENCETTPLAACRMLHALRLNGWFQHAKGILIGRCNAPDNTTFSHRDGLMDALGDLGIPVIYDCDFGHRQPQMLLVNGAFAEVALQGDKKIVKQSFK